MSGEFWGRVERLYWVSALGLGAVALGLEALLGHAYLMALGTLYLGVTLLLFGRGRTAIAVHLLYSLASTLLLLWGVPELPLAGAPGPFAAAVVVLAVLALGVFAGGFWAALGALALTLGWPGMGLYARIGLLGVYVLAGFLGVRIRGWLSELARTQAELRWLALHDALTGLGNRRALEGAYRALFTPPPNRGYLTVWDLDGLKRINDRDGHAAGDAALAELARVLREEGREGDRFFRTGGDEFAGLHLASAPPVGLIERVRRRFPAVSAGWAELGEDGLAGAMARADRRMYADKRERRAG